MKRIKNITLAGHNGSGKTSLAEALLYKVGVSDRLGKTTDGTTIRQPPRPEAPQAAQSSRQSAIRSTPTTASPPGCSA